MRLPTSSELPCTAIVRREREVGSLSRPLRAVFGRYGGRPANRLSRSILLFIGATLFPFRPARSPCRRAQRRSRMARLRATASAARSVLDGREHDGMLDRVGAAISPCRTNHQKASAKDHQKKNSCSVPGGTRCRGRVGGSRRPVLRASVDPCIVPLKRGYRPVDKRRASHPLPQAAFKLASFSRLPCLAEAVEHCRKIGECSFIHLIVIAGLRRRASASSAFASSILPAWA